VAKRKTTETKGAASGQANGQGGAKGETVAGYFRKLFEQNPAWLEARSNDEVLSRWKQDHPEEKEVPERVKQNLSNVKSVMRKKLRSKPGKKKGSQPREATAVTTAPAEAPRKPVRGLESLEEQIDDCLALAKVIDREQLRDAIQHLRRARNLVVWETGK